jgi:hypothetical protein
LLSFSAAVQATEGDSLNVVLQSMRSGGPPAAQALSSLVDPALSDDVEVVQLRQLLTRLVSGCAERARGDLLLATAHRLRALAKAALIEAPADDIAMLRLRRHIAIATMRMIEVHRLRGDCASALLSGAEALDDRSLSGVLTEAEYASIAVGTARCLAETGAPAEASRRAEQLFARSPDWGIKDGAAMNFRMEMLRTHGWPRSHAEYLKQATAIRDDPRYAGLVQRAWIGNELVLGYLAADRHAEAYEVACSIVAELAPRYPAGKPIPQRSGGGRDSFYADIYAQQLMLIGALARMRGDATAAAEAFGTLRSVFGDRFSDVEHIPDIESYLRSFAQLGTGAPSLNETPVEDTTVRK